MQVKHQEGRGIIPRQRGTEDIPLRLDTVIGIRRWGGGRPDQEEQGDNHQIGVRGGTDHQESEGNVATADHSPESECPGGTAALNQVHRQQMEPQRTPPRLILTLLRGKGALPLEVAPPLETAQGTNEPRRPLPTTCVGHEFQ